MIRAVEPSYLDFYWARIFPQIKDSLNNTGNEQNPLHVYDKIKNKNYILLVVMEGRGVLAHVTLEKGEVPNKTFLNVVTCGGEKLKTWLGDILKVIEKIAKEMNCQSIYMAGRRGWEKVLTDYQPTFTVFTKEL